MSDPTQIRASYIISTRNRCEFLDQAIKNVREFIAPGDELIIIDGGSTDNTAVVIEKNRDIVTIFRSEPDYGEAHGFNKGILASSGRYIKILTDDDYFYPDAMRHAISVLESHPEVDALQCGGEAFQFDPTTKETKLLRYQYLPSPLKLTDINILHYVPCGIGLVLTKTVIERVGLFDTTFYAVDRDIMSRLIACKVNFKYLNTKLYRHISYPHSKEIDSEKLNRDIVRVLIRNKEWEEITNYPKSAIGEALGLKDLAGGNLMVEFIQSAEILRQSRLRLLFTMLGWGMRLIRFILKPFVLIAWKIKPKKQGIASKRLLLLNDQVWDGDLR